MSQTIKVRRPTASEIRQLNQRLLTLTDRRQKRRAEALTLYGMGLTPNDEIAATQAIHPNAIYRELQAFAQVGVEAVTQLCTSGAPRQITEDQIAQSYSWSAITSGCWLAIWTLVVENITHISDSAPYYQIVGTGALAAIVQKRFLLPADPTQIGQSRPAPTIKPSNPL